MMSVEGFFTSPLERARERRLLRVVEKAGVGKI